MRILDNPESFRAFAAIALRLLLEEGMAIDEALIFTTFRNRYVVII